MAYVALYRTYRPKTFREVAGQKVIVQTCALPISHNKIGHAYLFSGPRGTGKTSIAKIFAKAVNCLNPHEGNPCNECDICKGLDKGDISDVIEIDAASNNGVDEIRDLRDKVKYMPGASKYKVYIIDEVHMLTTGAFNALLKTLEEPPKHVIFILATTEAYKIPATILSRCQRFDFKNLDTDEIYDKLSEISEKESINIDDEAKQIIAVSVEGGMRDALSLFDQIISYAGNSITLDDVHQVSGSVATNALIDILEALDKKQVQVALNILIELIQSGKEVSRITSDLIRALRDLLLEKKTTVKNPKYDRLKHFNVNKIYFYLDILNKLQNDLKYTHQKRMYIELAFIKMVDHHMLKQIDYDAEIENLKLEIQELKTQAREIPVPTKTLIPQDKKPLVTSKVIEEILNNGDKEKRLILDNGWAALKDYPIDELKLAAHLLSQAQLVAVSNKMLIVYEDLSFCEQIMSKELKKQVFKILNNKQKLIDDYYAIQKSDWEYVLNHYKQQYQQGVEFPTIPEHDFKLYEQPKIKKDKTPEVVSLAKEYFGDKVIVED